MKNLISLILISAALSSCSLFHTHKVEVVQGNVISQEEVNQLHRGMSEQQVKSIMGTPLLVNLFTPNRIDYIYTYRSYDIHQEQRLTCIFRNGRLEEIIKG